MDLITVLSYIGFGISVIILIWMMRKYTLKEDSLKYKFGIMMMYISVFSLLADIFAFLGEKLTIGSIISFLIFFSLGYLLVCDYNING